MDPEGSLLCPEQPNTCPNPKPAEPSQHHPILYLKDLF